MQLPPLNAHQAVVVYIAQSAESSRTMPSPPSALDVIARDGCNGSLACVSLETSKTTPFQQVLGMDTNESPSMYVASLQSRAIPHVVLSTSTDTCAKLAHAATMEHSSMDKLPARILQILAPGTRTIVVVHVPNVPDALDRCLASILTASPHCFVGVVQATDQQPPPPSTVAAFPLPKQSWQKRAGVYMEEISTTTTSWLIYAFYLRHQTRQDTVTAFDDTAILRHGGYGAMQAPVALQEVAFRLGYVPKYGA
ncbi:Aste57867_16535 [Aphanomyces stellatus]|uniref:Aste57867_16535 protein n=1 Tax=Aphanomyces stellatus TaxID=120398 RepID=A0A485L6W6_9STRA|nr:hypothetical protein As57867_016478 [Aphanomyces stellatus]VFT93309.1 Aste57867_16535 [Aphanomyces stellatus]